jgi:lipopolysaccharide export system protein LptA
MAGPPFVRRLRRLLLGLLAALVAGLIGLYLFGRSGGESPQRPAAGEEGPASEATVVGEGFDYSLEQGGATRFRIRGASYQVDRDDKVHLQQMGLTLFAEGGETYQVESHQAVFDPKTDETVLDGKVRVRGPGGIEVSAPKLELLDKGQVLLSRGSVGFRYGETARGGADRLRAELTEHIYVLVGNVWARSQEGQPVPFALRADRAFLDRKRHQMRCDGDVRLGYGQHRLDAWRVLLWLSEDDREVEFVRAGQGVSGWLVAAGGEEPAAPVSFAGGSMSAVFLPGSKELEKFELAGTKKQQAVVLAPAPGGLLRRFAAGYLVGALTGGELARLEALSGLTFAEYAVASPPPPPPAAAADLEPVALPPDPQGEPLRRLRADRGDATYGPGGVLQEVEVHGGVEYQDPQASARGDRGTYRIASGEGEFFGAPAVLHSADGDLTAPHVEYATSSGVLHADGGARTELTERQAGALSRTPLAHGEGPIRVESAEAFLRRSPQAFLFRGEVRAWRGENLLLSDELAGDDDEGRVTAKGHVRTLWYPEARPAAGERLPLEVTADGMVYLRGAATVTYSGSVRAVEGQRSLACRELEVELDEQGRAKRLLASDRVQIRDGESGRTVTGDRARYDLDGDTIEVEGETVVMKDREGGQVKGKRLVYHFDTGAAEVKGADQAPGTAAAPGAAEGAAEPPPVPPAAATGQPPESPG